MLLACVAAAQSAATPSLIERISRALHKPPEVYKRLVSLRAGDESITGPTPGTAIALADLQSRTEKIIGNCGQCWSPTPAGEAGIVFLKVDGLWVLPADGKKAKLAVASDGLYAILGTNRDEATQALVLRRHRGGQPCSYTLELADIGAAAIKPAAGEQEECVPEKELPSLIRTDAVREESVLETSAPGAGVRRILKWQIPPPGKLGRPIRESLLPWIEQQNDGLHRFDAAWVSDNEIVYLQKP